MVRRTLLAAFVSVCALSIETSAAEQCTQDIIEDLSMSGDVLITPAGGVYKVLLGDEVRSMLWLPASRVRICVMSISVRGKYMTMYQIFNLDNPQSVVNAMRLH